MFEPSLRIDLKDALAHPFMRSYTMSRGGIVSHPVSQKHADKGREVTKSTTDMINDFMDNCKDERQGYIGPTGKYHKTRDGQIPPS